MHKTTLWLVFASLCIYFSVVFCEDSNLQSKDSKDLLTKDASLLDVVARTGRKHHYHLYSMWGFYGLALAFLVKIKVVAAAFLVGSAAYLGLRYWWPHKCHGGEIYKEGSVILDHPPSFAHYDHTGYALRHDPYQGHQYDSGGDSYEPYGSYSSQSIPQADESFPSALYTEANGTPESFSSHASTFRRKRSYSTKSREDESISGALENLARQMNVNEAQIGEFMLAFLGLDTSACRRRFICEMEFKSKANPLTSLAFRVIGRSFFAKYVNGEDPLAKANSFEECASVNAECVFIENNEGESTHGTEVNNTALGEQEVPETAILQGNGIVEKKNESNLKLELRKASYRGRLRGDRHLKFL